MKMKNKYKSFMSIAKDRYIDTSISVKMLALSFRIIFYIVSAGWAIIPLMQSDKMIYLCTAICLAASYISIGGMLVIVYAKVLFSRDIFLYLPISDREAGVLRGFVMSKGIFAMSVIGCIFSYVLELMLCVTGDYRINVFCIIPLAIGVVASIIVYIIEAFIAGENMLNDGEKLWIK